MKQEATLLAELLAKISNVHTQAEIEPEHMHMLYVYACQCADRGEVKTADELLYVLLLLDAFNFDYALSLGLCRQKQGLHQEALFYFLRASAIKRADPRPLYHAASSYQKLGDVNSARRALTGVMQCDPEADAEVNTSTTSESYQIQCQALQKKAQHLLEQLPPAVAQ